jgi:hypothetical protein
MEILLIVNDGSQSLYQRRKFTWKSVGVQALGRSKRLSQNYRNTQEILQRPGPWCRALGERR